MVDTFELRHVRVVFVADSALYAVHLVDLPVLRHTPRTREEVEKIKLLPSVVGRDILNRFQVTLHRARRVVRLEA